MKRNFLLFISSLLFVSFVFFSYLVAKEYFLQTDFDTTVRLQNHISRRWDFLFSFFSVLGSVEVTGLFCAGLGLWLLVKRYFITFLSLFLLPAALAIEVFGKLFVYHPGPPLLLYRGVINFNFLPSTYVHTDYSYPSGHLTRTAFIIFFLLVIFNLKVGKSKRLPLQIGLITFLLVMAVSRVYLGEHWTSDVIGGTLLGSSLGVLAALTLPKPKKAGGLQTPQQWSRQAPEDAYNLD